MRKFLALIFSFPLFASVNEPLTFEWQTGYRNDRIHWHLQDPGASGNLTLSELYRDIEYWENGLVVKAVHRDLTFYLRGSYGTFGRGDGVQKTPNNTQRTFSTKGWCVDALGYFGYAVNLTAGRTYKVILTPIIGYVGYFESLERSTQILPKNFRLSWNGVMLGGSFSIQPVSPLEFFVRYAFHFLENDVHTAVLQDSVRQSIRSKSEGNTGHTGAVAMDWVISPSWRVGLNANLYYLTTRVVEATIKQAGRGDFSEKLKLRWTVVSGGAHISRRF